MRRARQRRTASAAPGAGAGNAGRRPPAAPASGAER